MHSSRSRILVALLAAVLIPFAAPVAARADGAADAASAGVGVARISLIQGAVAVQRGDSASPVAAAVNAPVLGADYVTTGDGARAEFQFDGSTSVRLGAGVQMRLTHLDAADRELQLAAGTIDVRLLRGTDGRSQVDTPSISVRPRATGRYRVSVDASGRTEVTVRSGSADVVTPQGAQVLAPGTTLLAQGTSANPSISSSAAIADDDFDRFNRERDDRQDRALANAAYTAPGVAGIDDLDTYGRWVTDGGYGRVWVPTTVASSWAPYRDGRWVWEEGYGWTWLGYEPWGWAPYHYGRWYHSTAYGWCWYPERAFVTWRPGIVAFLGFGSGFGFGFGDIGWVPLAPFETFYPWWGNRYGNNVTYVTNNYYYGNVNNGNITNNNTAVAHGKIFGNAKYNGVTYVPHKNFVGGNFEHPRAVDPSKLRSIHPVRGIVPAVPTDANLRFSDRPVPAQLTAVSSALTGGTFAGNTIAVRRTPFVQQREAVATAAHVRAATAPKPQQPDVPRVVPVTYGTTTTTVPVTGTRGVTAVREVNDPWARFGASRGTAVTHTATSANAVTPATRNAPESDAWRHLDQTRPAGPRDAAPVRESGSARSADARRATSVQEPTRSYNAPRSAPPQQAAQPPAAAQQRSAPPPARTEHPPAAKSSTPH
jgi:hypothetical protein